MVPLSNYFVILLYQYSDCAKILNTYLCLFSINIFLFSNKMVFRSGIHKMLFRIANREDPDQTASEEAV